MPRSAGPKPRPEIQSFKRCICDPSSAALLDGRSHWPHYIKHALDESDESACDRWVENPYWHYFCAEEYLQHELPIAPSSVTRWRDPAGPKLFDDLLGLRIQLALGLKLVQAARQKGLSLRQSCARKDPEALRRQGRLQL